MLVSRFSQFITISMIYFNFFVLYLLSSFMPSRFLLYLKNIFCFKIISNILSFCLLVLFNISFFSPHVYVFDHLEYFFAIGSEVESHILFYFPLGYSIDKNHLLNSMYFLHRFKNPLLIYTKFLHAFSGFLSFFVC